MLPAYAELHCLSNFSFQRGASHPEELVAQAAAFGYRAIALTDECSFAGVVRAWRALQALPETGRPRLIVGCELRLADGPCLVLLAADRAGYGRLSRLVTQARRSAEKGRYHLTRAMLDAVRECEGEGAAAEALPGCLALLIPPDGFPPPDAPLDAAIALRSEARWLAKRFPGRAWIAHTPRLDGRDPARLHWILRIAQGAGIRAVAAGGALMHDATRRPLADVMTALRLHC
ncbi:MAG: PHP domain-containing protein, partial [Thauera sp.]|nr:PHP domain-containing protein [Thauera sp.]